MIRTTGISLSRPWTLLRRRPSHDDTVAKPRDEVAEAQARRQREAVLQAHKEAVRASFIHGGGWYF